MNVFSVCIWSGSSMTLDKTDLTWEARHEQATITQCQAAWAQSHKELELFYFQTTSKESPMKMYGPGCLHLLLEPERVFARVWVKRPDICTPRAAHKTVQISLSTNMMLTLSSGKWKSWELREVILDSRYNKHYKLKTLKFFLLWGNVVITEHNK